MVYKMKGAGSKWRGLRRDIRLHQAAFQSTHRVENKEFKLRVYNSHKDSQN